MMRTILLTLATVVLAVAQSDPKPPAGVPANAQKINEDTWRIVDEKGKVWHYKSSPFGWMKAPALSVAEQQKRDGVGDPIEDITVKEEGEMLRFSRPGPFGAYNWTKKKTNLDEAEKAVWSRAQTQKSAKAPASSAPAPVPAAPVKE